jgi:hypothetical protein
MIASGGLQRIGAETMAPRAETFFKDHPRRWGVRARR